MSKLTYAFHDLGVPSFPLNNIDKPSINIERYISGASCPTCEGGVLIGSRDPNTLKFLKEDRCLLCGQLVIYDILEKGVFDECE